MSQQVARLKAIPPVQQSQKGSFRFGYVSRAAGTQSFDDDIKQLESEGRIPNLDLEAEYTIYRWKPCFAGHESIVLGCRGKFFTIEIRVMGNTFALYTTADNINLDKLIECGKKVSTGTNLICKAHEVYNETSNFNFALQNCQDFVNNYLKAIEMVEEVKGTDAGWLFKVISAAAVGALSLFAYKRTRK